MIIVVEALYGLLDRSQARDDLWHLVVFVYRSEVLYTYTLDPPGDIGFGRRRAYRSQRSDQIQVPPGCT